MRTIFRAGTADHDLTFGAGPEVHLIRCRVPRDIFARVEWEAGARGLFRMRDCHSGDSSDMTQTSVAFDCDLTGPDGGARHPRLSNGRVPKVKDGFLLYWPPCNPFDVDGVESRLLLPPDALLRSIRIRKGAKGSSTGFYRLAAVSDTGLYVYGTSALAAQNALHIITADNINLVLSDAERQTMRIVPVVEVAFSAQTADFAVGGSSPGTHRARRPGCW